MLRWRLLSAFVILSTLISLVWLDANYNFDRPGIWLAPMAIVMAGMAAQELLDLFSSLPYRASTVGATLGAVAVTTASCAPLLWVEYPQDCVLGRLGWPLAAMALSTIGVLGIEMARYREPGSTVIQAALGVFVIAYVGVQFSFLAALRTLGDNTLGLVALLSMIVAAKMTDVGAYTFGRIFGRTKLAPVLSPGKTIEGAIGGLLTACASSYAFFFFIAPSIRGQEATTPWWGALLYGLVVGIAAMGGDLAESVIKRDTQRKDSSRWLPGLGGIMDIIDSLLFAAPVAYLCWVAKLLGE